MDYTREPIIETVITPKDGCKLAVRNSKGAGTEEYFVDALEVVSFGHSFFFRSLERPKSFLLPVGDYEVLEVREPRMALKHIGVERAIKIGGGRDAGKPIKEPVATESEESPPVEPRVERKRERRRYRRRRGQQEEKDGIEQEPEEVLATPLPAEPKPAKSQVKRENKKTKKESVPKKAVSEGKSEAGETQGTLLQPPTTLISETISRYRESGLYAGAFFDENELTKESEQAEEGCTSSEEVGDDPARFCEPFSEEVEQTLADSSDQAGYAPISGGADEENVEASAEAAEGIVSKEKGAETISDAEEAPSKRMSFADIVEEMSENNS